MSKADVEASSDPLPFLQVDRAAIALAASVGRAFGISHQEALGGLVLFWGRCSDPRELEALVEEGKREVLLDGAALSRRLVLAFGKDLDHELLVELQVLAADAGKGYRVRGMSRAFRAIDARKIAQAKGAAGGKKSAETRKTKTKPSSTPAQPAAQAGSNQRAESRAQSSDPSSAYAEEEHKDLREPDQTELIQHSDAWWLSKEPQGWLSMRRSLSWQEETVIDMLEMRVDATVESDHQVELATSSFAPQWINTVIGKLAKLAGFVGPPLQVKLPNGEMGELPQGRRVAHVFKHFLEKDRFRNKGWPLRLFLSDGVFLELLQEYRAEQAQLQAEGVH